MGAWMARAGAEILAEADALAPIPLHYTRLWRRQFNQAAALARAVAAECGKPVRAGLLARVRRTRSQVGLSRDRARQNLQGAFRCPETAELSGRRIVLVDDVLTSGATANAAARALLRGGAKRGRRAGFRAGGEMIRLAPGCADIKTSHISRSSGVLTLPPIVIYTKSSCPYCHAAKDLLRRKGAPFEEISVDGDRAGAGGDGGQGGRPLDGAADLHRRGPCRRLRRPLRPRPSGAARPAAGEHDQVHARLRPGHEFESWFPDGASYEEQARRGFVICPECNSPRIAKAPMAPAIVSPRPGRGAERRSR